MSIERFRQDADLLLRHFDLQRATGGRFDMQVDHVYSGDPVARSWHWTSAGDERDRRASAQIMVMLKVVAGRDWHVLDFEAPRLQHRRPQAGASALGKASGEWHILTFQGTGEGHALDSGFMLFEAAADFDAVRDELERPAAA